MAEGSSSRIRDALAQRDFRVLVTAFVIDQVGTWAYNVVLLVYVYERTGSSASVAAVSAARWLPGLLLGPYAGVLGDRYERTVVMRASAVLGAITMLGLAGAVHANAPIWVLLALAALTAVVVCPYAPAAGALRPEVVVEKDLAAANAVFSTLESLVIVVGPLLGAALLTVHERSLAFLLNAASFVLAAVLVSRLHVRSGTPEGEPGSFRAQLVAGFTTLWHEPVALTLVLFVALDSAVYGASTVLYIPISEHLGQGPHGYGFLITSFALGGVLAGGMVNRLSGVARLTPVVLLGMLLLGIPFALTALTTLPVVGAALQCVAGAGMVAVDVLALTALQRDLPREVLSRVLGILQTCALGGMLLGSVLLVPLLQGAGLRIALVVLTTVVVVVSVAGLLPLVHADRRGAATHALLSPRVSLLEALDLFADAPRSTLEQLAAAVQVVELEAGATLINQGERADALWIIVTGAVEILSVGPRGREKPHSGLGAHSYVGEIGLLRGIPRTATVRTTALSTLWRIPAPDFHAALGSATASSSLQAVSQARLAQLPPSLSGVRH